MSSISKGYTRNLWARQRMRHIHFVGVGGAGMSGIAEVLFNLGYRVSGSDLKESQNTNRLSGLGVQLSFGHAAENLGDADVLVVSSAVNEQNPEVQAARARGIPVVPRAEMLAELMRLRFGIAIAGTHGKTTTTSLVTSLLTEAGLDPTFVIGGKLNSADANARLGESDYLVAEADESDASFLYLQPMIAVVTNLDQDHMGTYGNSFSRLRETFLEFLHHLPFYGQAVLCLDDANLRGLLPDLARPCLTYGLGEEADVRAIEVRQQGLLNHFVVQQQGYANLELTLNMPGRHNVLNALAAIAVARLLEVDDATIHKALLEFSGVGRRFQWRDCRFGGGSLTLVDDYAHHPRELEATLEAARASWPGRRLLLVFQPHRYSRTLELFDDFVMVLSKVDLLLLAGVYAAGEQPLDGADSRSLGRSIRARGLIEPILFDSLDELEQLLRRQLLDADVVIMAGAGSIGSWVQAMPARLESTTDNRQGGGA
jgi:UDP-N-acetylmuramate--alanine ligase